MRRFQGIFLSSLPFVAALLSDNTDLAKHGVGGCGAISGHRRPFLSAYLCLGLPGQPWDQPWGVTPYQVLPSRLNRLLYGSLTLSESTSENGSEDCGSSGCGDVGRMELNGSPSNVAIMPPPGLSQDIGEVAKVYPAGQLASRILPFQPSPSHFESKKIPPPPPPLLRAPSRKMPKDAARCRKQCNFQNFILPSSSKATTRRSIFELVPRLIGRNGDNMKKIRDETGARVIVCGRGSGWIEVKSPHGYFERDEPLQLAVSCRSMKIREAASQGWLGNKLSSSLCRIQPYITLQSL